MCFSPQASFVGAAVLAVVGFATVRKALRVNRSMLVLALFPVIWSVHQLIEGIVWLDVGTPQDGVVFRYLYLIIAFLVWPIMLPLSVVTMERHKRIRMVAAGLLVCGMCVTVYLSAVLFMAQSVSVSVVGHSLCYRPNTPEPPYSLQFAYAIVTISSMFLSSRPLARLFGFLAAIAWAISFIFLHQVYVSVWCMACAFISSLIFFAIKKTPETGEVKEPLTV